LKILFLGWGWENHQVMILNYDGLHQPISTVIKAGVAGGV
jgi:hypothetical protein